MTCCNFLFSLFFNSFRHFKCSSYHLFILSSTSFFVRFRFQKFSIVRNFTYVAIIGISGKKDSILIIVATKLSVAKSLHQTTYTNRTQPTCYHHCRQIFSFHAQGRFTVHCLSNVLLRQNYTIQLHHQQLTVSSTTTERYELGQLPCPATRSQSDHLDQHSRISCVEQYSRLKTASAITTNKTTSS